MSYQSIIVAQSIQGTSRAGVAVYAARADDFEVAPGVSYHKNDWDLAKEMTKAHLCPSGTHLDFEKIVPPEFDFPPSQRQRLIRVTKDYFVWQRKKGQIAWETIIVKGPWLFTPLFEMMADKDYQAIGDISSAHLKAYVLNSGLSADSEIRRWGLLSNLYQLRIAGVLSDGPSVDVRTIVPRPKPNSAGASGRRGTMARPFDEETYLSGLFEAIEFVRHWKDKLVDELAVTTDTQFARRLLAAPSDEHSFEEDGIWPIVRLFQRACFIMIASTLIGRVNEFLDLKIGCCQEKEIDGEKTFVVEKVTSKHGEERRLEVSLGIGLTAEAVAALESITAAYPPTANSKFLFTNMAAYRRGSRAIGAPVGYPSVRGGIPTFMRWFVGLTRAAAEKIKLHRFRATTMMKLCQERHGILTTQRQARMKDIRNVTEYVAPEVVSGAIGRHLDHITESDF